MQAPRRSDESGVSRQCGQRRDGAEEPPPRIADAARVGSAVAAARRRVRYAGGPRHAAAAGPESRTPPQRGYNARLARPGASS
jgi:hypothetical protein